MKINSIIESFPFAGNAIVYNAAAEAVTTRTSLQERYDQTISSVRKIGFLAGLHAVHAFSGAVETQDTVNDVLEGGFDARSAMSLAVTGTFAAVNAAMVTSQVGVAHRVYGSYQDFRDQDATIHGNNKRFEPREISLTDMTVSLSAYGAYMGNLFV